MPSTKSVAAVVLDMDGLMLDTEAIYKPAWQSAAAEFGYDLDDTFYLTLVGRDTADGEGALLQRFGGDFPVAEFRARWSQLWKTHVQVSGIPVKPGLPELLSFLDRCQVPAAVATSSDQEYASLSLRSAGLEKRFNHVITGDQVLRGKPAPDVYETVLERCHVSPDRALVVEDSETGVRAALAAGTFVVVVRTTVVSDSPRFLGLFPDLATLVDGIKLPR